jgi:hypothetical protein
MDRQDGSMSSSDNGLGHAAHQGPLQASAAVRAHDDHVERSSAGEQEKRSDR